MKKKGRNMNKVESITPAEMALIRVLRAQQASSSSEVFVEAVETLRPVASQSAATQSAPAVVAVRRKYKPRVRPSKANPSIVPPPEPDWTKVVKLCSHCKNHKKVVPDFGLRKMGVGKNHAPQPWCRACRNKEDYHARARKNAYAPRRKLQG